MPFNRSALTNWTYPHITAQNIKSVTFKNIIDICARILKNKKGQKKTKNDIKIDKN